MVYLKKKSMLPASSEYRNHMNQQLSLNKANSMHNNSLEWRAKSAMRNPSSNKNDSNLSLISIGKNNGPQNLS